MCGEPMQGTRPGKYCSRECRLVGERAKAKKYTSNNRKINEAILVESIRLNGCPVCGPVDGYIDIYAFAFHHFDPTKKCNEMGKLMAGGPERVTAELAQGASLHCGCHVRLHCSRHLGRWKGLKPLLPGETRESQFRRIAAACRAEVEEEKKAQGFFLP